MKLHCLGTAGFHPNDTRQTSCYALPESGIVLDAGSGIFRLTSLIKTDSIDLLLSHAHLDHIMGLTFLFDVFYERPVKRLRIWGQQEKLATIREHLFSELIFPVDLECEWKAIDDVSEFCIGGAKVTWRHQEHPGGSVAYRFDWQQQQKQLVYATDTTGDLGEAWTSWAAEVDLLMHECYFRDESAEWAETTGHSWTSRVAEVAALCRPRQLLLTHINPLEKADDPVDSDLIRAKTSADVTIAEDGMIVDF